MFACNARLRFRDYCGTSEQAPVECGPQFEARVFKTALELYSDCKFTRKFVHELVQAEIRLHLPDIWLAYKFDRIVGEHKIVS